VIALVGNLFYGAGVSACILFLNNNKPLAHRGKICMIDATGIHTAQRAKNIMTEADTDQVFRLWQGYESVIDKCVIVDLETVKAKDYTLSVNAYIEKTPAPPIDPKKIRANFYAALKEVHDSEEALMQPIFQIWCASSVPGKMGNCSGKTISIGNPGIWSEDAGFPQLTLTSRSTAASSRGRLWRII
jgi:type I restriction enzyme M protein